MAAPGISHRRLAWIIFLGLCILIGGWRAWETYRYQTASQAWNRNVNLAEAQSQVQSGQAFKRIGPFFRSLRELERSREKVETALGLGAPLERSSRQDEVDYLYQDPVTKGYVHLSFGKGRWNGVGTGDPSGGVYRVPKPTRDRFFVAFEAIRPWIAGWNRGLGPLAWLLLLASLLFARGYRRVISEWMLAVAIVCCVAWLLHPAYSLSVRGMMSNDMLFWAAIMLTLSSFSLVIASRRRPPAYPECDNCGYNLTGNVSGVCPECGEALEDSVLSK